MPMRKSLRKYPKRGEVYIADLDPAFGREIHKKRPILIISNNLLNQHSANVIMIPLSSIVPQFINPAMIKISGIRDLDKESVILVEHIRSIDQERLIKKIGDISKEKLLDVEEALKLSLGMIPLE